MGDIDLILAPYEAKPRVVKSGGVIEERLEIPEWLCPRLFHPHPPIIDREMWEVLEGSRKPPRGFDVDAARALEYRRCAENPWYFITNYCTTEDQHDPDTPWKLLPQWYHLWLTVMVIHNNNMISIAKARQMMETWVVTAYLLWRTIFWRGQLSFIQARKFDNANYTLNTRMRHIWRNLPPFLQGLTPVDKHPFTEGVFRLDGNQSEVRAIEQGGDQFRQYTADVIFSDEAGFQGEIEASYQAGRPLIDNSKTAKYIMVSTPSRNFWSKLHLDQLNSLHKAEIGHVGERVVLQRRLGFDSIVARRCSNGFVAVDIHWSAHPSRDDTWAAQMRGSMTEQKWQTEYCVNFDIVSGDVVFPMFDIRVHGYDDSDELPLFSSVYEGIDHGMRSPTACIWARVAQNGDIYADDEYYRSDLIIRDNCKQILEKRKNVLLRAGQTKVEATYIDPSTRKRAETQYSTILGEYIVNGISPRPADNNQQKKINSLAERMIATLARHSEQTGKLHDYFLERGITDIKDLAYPKDHYKFPGVRYSQTPAFKVSRTRCKNLIRELLIWKMKDPPTNTIDHPTPEKPVDANDHAIDAIMYITVMNPTFAAQTLNVTPLGTTRDLLIETAQDLAKAQIMTNENLQEEDMDAVTKEIFETLVRKLATTTHY